jgi:CDP-diacylglycerol---glycerol-3-phosphate 3-phosphatidyltransferase
MPHTPGVLPTDPLAADLSAWKRSLPNRLTLARVALAGVFFAVLSSHRLQPGVSPADPDLRLLLAAVVFIVAAATDALDGFLARRWRVESVFGRIMDPFADKLLVLGGFVFLAGPAFTLETQRQGSGVDPWMVVVIIARELLITSLRAAVESRGVSFAATLSGKLKMILQSACIPAVLLLLALFPPIDAAGARTPAGLAIAGLVWATVVVSAWSGVPYILRAARALR